MKTSIHKTPFPAHGFSLIELTIVIAIILLLTGSLFFGAKAYQDWQRGLEAGESLKKVYAAQKIYLAENPTKAVSAITADDVIKHMPDGSTALPVLTGLKDEALVIDVAVSPPVFTTGGANYDPSDSTTDNLWDTGK